MNRIFEFWVGAQSSGKTYQLRKRARAVADRPSIRRVVVVAPPGEWSDVADRISLADMDRALVDWGGPRRPVLPLVELGDPVALERILRVCAAWGDCAVVLDESAFWIPSSLSTEALRQRSPALMRALVRGRHLERSDGMERPLHLIIAAQYPKSVHLLVRDQARTVMVSRPDGDATRDWIRADAGRVAMDRAQSLGDHQWTPIRGRDPRRG